ncbi:MAG TPA: response regulator [Terriglobia bacterium]|nr:response regulator [Terriglobia bacterium]
MESNRQLNGIRILIVEDDRDTREMVQFILERDGAVVTSAESVPQAMDVYSTFAPHVIVADIGMPDYNGYALIARIREDDATHGRVTPAIALTAYTSPADRDQALSAGFQEYMAKPFDPGQLISTISKLAGFTGPSDVTNPAA